MSLLLTLTVMTASAALIVAATHQSRVSERMMTQRAHSGLRQQ